MVAVDEGGVDLAQAWAGGQPQLEIPKPQPRPRKPEQAEDEANRGVIILDLGGD